MTRSRRTRRRRLASISALGLMTGLPAASFFLAPSAHADDTPGANLAGINATAYASGVQIAPLTPGLVGAGNVTQGNLIEGAVPYAAASTSTGPSSSAVASPAYPGDTAAGAGNAIATFAPQFPSTLTNALNYPVLARADYPPQLHTGSSSNYNPPETNGTGVGTASASATEAGSTCQSSTASQSFNSSGVSVGSSSASSSTVLSASSVQASSHTDVGTMSLLAGAIKIGGVTSDASATSDGKNGHETSSFAIGAVTVLGQPASIGPNGITLKGSGSGQGLIPDANQVLVALQQAGISVHSIAPSYTTDGAQTTVTSGGLVIAFQDNNIPNPNGQVPVSSLGFDLNLGISEASADATGLPPFANQPGGTGPITGGPVPSVSTGISSGPVPQATGGSVSNPPVSNGSVPAGTVPSRTSSGNTAPVYSPPENLLGAPIKVAWVVIAFLLSLVAAGPLLGYANWQLLRGEEVMNPEDAPMASIYEPNVDPDTAPPGTPGRSDRKPSRMARLRTSNLDLRNTWQIIAGALLLPLGIAFILLAWSGAAHGRVDQQQIPYLVSGGIGGLAVVMIGCFFYWAHWLYRIYDQADLHHQEAMQEQRELIRSLIEAVAAAGATNRSAAVDPNLTMSANGSGGARTFVATPTGTNFHTAGCPMVANRGDALRTVTESEAAEMKPCRVCEPLVTSN